MRKVFTQPFTIIGTAAVWAVDLEDATAQFRRFGIEDYARQGNLSAEEEDIGEAKAGVEQPKKPVSQAAEF